MTVLSTGKFLSAEGTFSLEDYPTIVNVVQIPLGIKWIFDNQSPAQAITVLVPEVAVIPECPLNSDEMSRL
jgi:hypothetical protein